MSPQALIPKIAGLWGGWGGRERSERRGSQKPAPAAGLPLPSSSFPGKRVTNCQTASQVSLAPRRGGRGRVTAVTARVLGEPGGGRGIEGEGPREGSRWGGGKTGESEGGRCDGSWGGEEEAGGRTGEEGKAEAGRREKGRRRGGGACQPVKRSVCRWVSDPPGRP